jgi:hypothetical protein
VFVHNGDPLWTDFLKNRIFATFKATLINLMLCQRLTAATGCRVNLRWCASCAGNRIALMHLLISLRKCNIKAALIAPTQLAASSLNKSVLLEVRKRRVCPQSNRLCGQARINE